MILFSEKYIKKLVMLSLILLGTLCADAVFARDVFIAPWELIQEAENKGNYLGAISLLRKQEEAYSSSSFRIQYFDLLATFESFLSMNQAALSDDDLANNSRGASKGRFEVEKYDLKNAKKVIIKAGSKHQAIFINEAHHSPQHRAFTLSLLQGLYDQGFRYFAAEGLDVMDTDLNARGYPLSQRTGLYTNEPMYGELIRAAQKIGFKIIAYEYAPNCDPWHDPPEKCQNLREEGQAKNLYEQVFKMDPSAKLLVHAGYGHIAKNGTDGWIPMAMYFEKLTGITPYSIDQTIMREHSLKEYEYGIYRQIADAGLLHKASIFISKDKSIYLAGYEGIYDLMVFHPRTRYKNNRPNWLIYSEHRREFVVDAGLCKGSYPCTVEALIQEEGLDSVPIDRIMISSLKNHPILALFPGRYFIRAIDNMGGQLSLNSKTVRWVLVRIAGFLCEFLKRLSCFPFIFLCFEVYCFD